MRNKLTCELEPKRRSCKSWRKPLLMARAMTSEATPAATPAIEIPVMIPMKAWRRLARRYRLAMKSSKRMRDFRRQHSAFSQVGLYRQTEWRALSFSPYVGSRTGHEPEQWDCGIGDAPHPCQGSQNRHGEILAR